jgi:septal ring factor EnvC (AmiA/AmiB activator)
METFHFVLGDFLSKHPDANKGETLSFFYRELDMDKQLRIIEKETNQFIGLQKEIRPHVLRKRELEEQIKEVAQAIEMEVAVAYPPRQGTDRDREALRSKLKKENTEYQRLDKQVRDVNETLFSLELELSEVQSQAKNARRMIEVFNSIMQYLGDK